MQFHTIGIPNRPAYSDETKISLIFHGARPCVPSTNFTRSCAAVHYKPLGYSVDPSHRWTAHHSLGAVVRFELGDFSRTL